MTPQAALQNHVFIAYAVLLGSALLAAALMLVVARWRMGSRTDHAWQSYRAWLFMAPAALAAVFLGRVAFIVFVIGLALAGFWEFAKATGLVRDRWLSAVAVIGIVSLAIAALVQDPDQETPGWYGLYVALPVFVVASLLLAPVLRNQTAGQLRLLALAVLGFIYLGWMFGHLALLANDQHSYGYLLFLMFAVECTDIAAYVCGRLWGKHPLRSEISPKKTWEGALGALAVGLMLPWLLWFSFPHFGPLELVLTGLLVGIGGQVGDLALSVIKRDVDVKDMGSIIPGHGGVLDRVDSLIYVAPLFFHLVRFSHELP